jgi:hypothetical protein
MLEGNEEQEGRKVKGKAADLKPLGRNRKTPLLFPIQPVLYRVSASPVARLTVLWGDVLINR